MPEPYIPLRGRVKAVYIVFGIAALVYAISACSGLLEVQLMNKVIAGTQVTDAELTSSDSRRQLLASISLLLFVACAIVFISWLWAAYRNVSVVAPSERRYSDSWAIFGWFVPFMAFWRPKQVVDDVWRAGGKDRVDAQPGGLLTFWWFVWLSLTVLTLVARGYEDAATPEEFRSWSIVNVITDAVSIVGALVAILVARMCTDRLDEKLAAVPPPAPPAPEGDFAVPERPAGVPA